MPRIIKNTLLNYIPSEFQVESTVNPARIFSLNNKPIKTGDIVYICEREIRAKDNFALQFALEKSKELNTPLKIIHPKVNYEYLPKQRFLDEQLEQARKIFHKLNLDFEIIDKTPAEIIHNMHPALVVLDFGVNVRGVNELGLNRDYRFGVDIVNCRVYEVDGHNIIPARVVSDKQEYSAATLRRKIYYGIYPFLTEFKNIPQEKVEADFVLEDFIKNKLSYYSELKNNPSESVLSNLSKYLNLGFISAQRVAIEIIKSDADALNKEAFLEELIIRKELADNFCLYANSFKDFSGVPNWAKTSLNFHKNDLRTYIYTKEVLENAQTHDKLWNATQTQLIKEGVTHGYLRMYWAKKILE